MTTVWTRFWNWYERHYTLNISIAAGLFVLQLLHLYWLGTDVVAQRALGESFWDPSSAIEWGLYVVDYTEIPVLLSVSLVYVNELRKGFGWTPLLFLIFLNSQWLHIFWITDELVVTKFNGEAATSSLPDALAWVAILIDYAELPVIFDTIRRVVVELREKRSLTALGALREESRTEQQAERVA